MSRLTSYVVVGACASAAGALVVTVLFWQTVQPPRDWWKVAHGQLRADVHRELPGGMTELGDIKGDFWSSPRTLGRWQMQVGYDAEGRVAAKHLTLYVGTKQTFKAIHFP